MTHTAALASNTATVAKLRGIGPLDLWAAVFVEEGGKPTGIRLLQASDYLDAADKAQAGADGMEFQLIEGVDFLLPTDGPKDPHILSHALNVWVATALEGFNAGEVLDHATA